MAAILGDFTVVVFAAAVVRTRPRTIPLAMITMRKSTHGFPFVFHMSMGLRLATLWTTGAPVRPCKEGEGNNNQDLEKEGEVWGRYKPRTELLKSK